MRIVSYNLRENTASGELTALATDNDIDILCLQEVDSTTLPERVEHLVLADATRNNRLGLAVYVRDERFEVKATKLLALKKSLHDRVMAPAHERLLAVHLFDKVRNRDVLVGSFHAAPLTASNSLRRKQIAAAHDGMRALAPGLPALMVGDFNYPWFINGLERRLQTEGFLLHRSTEPTYLRYKFFSGYFDFVTSTGYRVDQVDVLPAGASDHRAISFEAHLSTD